MLKKTKQFLAIGAIFVLICGIGFAKVIAGEVSPTSGIQIALDSTHIDRIISMFEGRVAEPEEKLGGFTNVLEVFSGGIETTATGPTSTLAGTTVITGMSNQSRTVLGGDVYSFTATSSGTLSSDDMCSNNLISHTASTTKPVVESLTTLTLASSTALFADANCLNTNGDEMWLTYRNSTSSYGASTTIAVASGGGNMDLNVLATTTANLIVLPQNTARMHIMRISSVTSTVNVQVFTAGD